MGPYGRKMARKSCSVMSKGRLRTISRLARLGVVSEVVSIDNEMKCKSRNEMSKIYF